MSVTVEFDQKVTYSFGLWRCPTCGTQFYGADFAVHKSDCAEDGYENCILVVGPSAVEKVTKWAETEGDEGAHHPLMPVNLRELREQIPEALS